MVAYDGELLRSIALNAGLDEARFKEQLEFVEWTAFHAPLLALSRARELEPTIPLFVESSDCARDYMWCRLALETATKYQHASGDALARLVFSVVSGDEPPALLQLATFERQLAPSLRGGPTVRAAKAMRATPEWKYIVAFSNTLKHMSVVKYHRLVVLGESSCFEFQPFEYKGTAFPASSQDELEATLRRVREDLFLVLAALQDELVAAGSG